ncbi:MAG: hypothetical protein IKT22_02880, partial [Prevotella sp.]|nr:hypothetical protein [Prevotella sp.]
QENSINGHEYVDLGLPSGLLWATCNVGAEKPEDYGDYFAWGETETKDSYKWDYYEWGTKNNLNKYTKTDNLTTLEADDDAATANWGEGWRMPTFDEIKELLDNTSSVWTTLNGVNGRQFTSNKNGKSIFFPASGYRSSGALFGKDENCLYWSSSRYSSPNYAYHMTFNSEVAIQEYELARYVGSCVRPVVEKTVLQTITITASANPAEGGTVTGGGTYEVGENVTLTATPNEGYKFVKWIANETQVSTDATYTFTASEDKSYQAVFESTGIEIDEHEYVDLGLPSGLLWATCNVGATKPEEYGLYFAWGETTGYTGDTSDGRSFDWENYKFGTSDALTKYTGSDGLTELEAKDDAATAKWGEGWRMPTKDEIKELLDNTTNEWTELNGVNGRKFTAKNGSGNSIFLPASGLRVGGSLQQVDSYGFCWSSSLGKGSPANAYYLLLDSERANDFGSGRYYGHCVRPVIGKDDIPTGIGAPLNDNGQLTNDSWYSIDGKKLNGEPTQKGVYIKNGKKVVK